jgi:hypothetical protein
LQLAQIQGQYGQNNNQIAASVDLAQINEQEQTTLGVSTLQSQVQEAAISNQTQQQQIATSGAVQMQEILATALTKQAQINSNTANAAIAAQAATNQQSLLSKIF